MTDSIQYRQAAKNAVIVTFAYDMFTGTGELRPKLSTYVEKDYILAGYITANDSILNINRDMYYGFVLQSKVNPKSYTVAIRGTADYIEFMINMNVFYHKTKHKFQGNVESGFYSIYNTMKYIPVEYGYTESLVNALGELMRDDCHLTIVGHSLGAALGTYLALDLCVLYKLGNRLTTCLLASPRVGDKEFVQYFQDNVPRYEVFNFCNDIVPNVPPKFLGYSSLKHINVFDDSEVQITKLFGFIPRVLCNHHSITYAALLDSDILDDIFEYPEEDQKACKSCIL